MKKLEWSKKHSNIYHMALEIMDTIVFEYNFAEDILSFSSLYEKQFNEQRVIKNYKANLKDKQIQELFEKQKEWKEEKVNLELQLRTADGVKWYRCFSQSFFEKEKPSYAVGSLISIQEEKNRIEELLEQTRKDWLTGLYNRKTCEQEIKEFLFTEKKKQAGMFIIDLDRFKLINDTLGHMAGDEVLIDTANTLQRIFQTRNVLIARWGGDEFVVFLKDIQKEEEIDGLCLEICQSLKKTYGDISRHQIELTVSIGFSYIQTENKFQDIYQKADLALYQAKARGKNQYFIETCNCQRKIKSQEKE